MAPPQELDADTPSTRGRKVRPLQWLQYLLEHRIVNFQRRDPANAIILAGDFNGSIGSRGGSHGDISTWVSSTGLLSAHHQINPASTACSFWKGGSHPTNLIDHVLFSDHRGIFPTGAWVHEEACWADISDHRIVVAPFFIPGTQAPGIPRAHLPPPPILADVDPSDPRHAAAFETALLRRTKHVRRPRVNDTEDASRFLQDISVASRTAATDVA